MLRESLLDVLHTRALGPGLTRRELRNLVEVPDPRTGGARRPAEVSVKNSVEALVAQGLVERDVLAGPVARAQYVYWRRA